MQCLKNNKQIIYILSITVFTLLAISCQGVLAQGAALTELESFQGQIEGSGIRTETNVYVVVGDIVKAVLSIIGVLLMIYLFTGGVMWMTSAGSSEKIKKAREMIVNAILGLVIVILSYAVATFIIKKAAGITE